MLSNIAKTIMRRFESRKARLKLARHVDRGELIHQRYGTVYGGWFVPGGVLTETSVCYCVGAGEDISFELELIREFGCEVYTFDPTPRATQHIAELYENTTKNLPSRINGSDTLKYEVNREGLAHLHFLPYGVWSENQTMKFYSPVDPTHVSHSILNLQRTDHYFEAECRTVGTIMESLGHKDLSLLKLDVEGAEHKVIRSLLDEGIRPTILCVEFDEGVVSPDEDYMSSILDTVSRLKQCGYLMTKLESWNATFVSISKLVAGTPMSAEKV
jgi:FkbM family methyltransferase